MQVVFLFNLQPDEPVPKRVKRVKVSPSLKAFVSVLCVHVYASVAQVV